MKNAIEIKDMELNQVNGGTFTPNMFTEEEYNKYGIKTNFHFFEKDEFKLPDGTDTDVKGANAYIKANFPEAYAKKIMPKKNNVRKMVF